MTCRRDQRIPAAAWDHAVRLGRIFYRSWPEYLAPNGEERLFLMSHFVADPQWLPEKTDVSIPWPTDAQRQSFRSMLLPILRGEPPSLDEMIGLAALYRRAAIELPIPFGWMGERASVVAADISDDSPLEWFIVPGDFTRILIPGHAVVEISHRSGMVSRAKRFLNDFSDPTETTIETFRGLLEAIGAAGDARVAKLLADLSSSEK